MNPSIPYFGEILALSTAFVWALAVILFKKSGETAHPIALNLFKNILAVTVFLPVFWFSGEDLFPAAPAGDYLLLLASGALGIGIADTLFFMSLNILGAALSSIVDCLYSPFIITLSILWLGETLSTWQAVGALMIVSAVAGATMGKRPVDLTRRRLFQGIALAALSMASMAVGIVGVKPLLERSPLLWVTEIRLLGGILTLALILILHRRRREILATLFHSHGWKFILPGSFLGTNVALMLWLGGMKWAQASVAAALNQTSNILVFVFAALFLRERITLQRAIGIVTGVIGAYLVTFG